jgi:hypothetical protein
MSGSDDLYQACAALLSVCEQALVSTPAGFTGLAAVYPGQPPADCCPMLAVWWSPITRPTTAPSQAALDVYHRMRVWINIVQFNVIALRCDGAIPDGAGMPTVASIQAAAKQVADDAWALNSYVSRRVQDNTLFGGYPCREVSMNGIQQLGAQGAYVGCQFAIQAELPGYES